MNKGFTLKHLIVVIALIVLISAIIYPVFQIVRYRVLEARCRANLWAIVVKYNLMKQQNGGKVDIKAFRQWLHESPESEAIRFCPLNRQNLMGVYKLAFDFDARNIKIMNRPRSEPPPPFYVDPRMVVFCPCHTRPLTRKRDCVIPVLNSYQVLAAYDNPLQVKYGYIYPQLVIPLDWLPADERE